MKAAPTFLPAFDPSEKRRISLSDGGRGKTRSGLKPALGTKGHATSSYGA